MGNPAIPKARRSDVPPAIASVLARAALNASISAAFVAKVPFGTSGSGAWAFFVRSGMTSR